MLHVLSFTGYSDSITLETLTLGSTLLGEEDPDMGSTLMEEEEAASPTQMSTEAG